MSVKRTWIGVASVPVAPKRTVLESTLVASKPLTLKIATLIFLLLLGLILLASFLGLMSTETTILPPWNSTAPRSQTPRRGFPSWSVLEHASGLAEFIAGLRARMG